jgi:hypothetical protein
MFTSLTSTDGDGRIAELSGLVRDAGSTFSAPPFIHARPGEARPALLVDNAGRVDHGAGR